jgi:hypothetical protein
MRDAIAAASPLIEDKMHLVLLDRLMAQQSAFMADLNVPTAAEIVGEPVLSDALYDAAVGVVCEAGEVLADLRSRNRPWKDGPNAEHVIEEMIDVFFYLMEAWLIMGLSASDVSAAYQSKLAKNYGRILAAKRTPNAHSSS